ncbi:ribulose-phosphate 3-epimerase [Candidatus Woesearchaeota archaeon]|nr:ribulose-phosphate 3-epimerase [Candidatus Woesearchaeota archaeon]
MKIQIIPSIIAKSQKELNKRIKRISRHAKLLQLDIMDGKFVKNNSINFDFRLFKKYKYEAHLMVNNPEEWIKKNSKKVNTIIFHIESTKKPNELINLIKMKNKKVGIALNPNTKIKKIKLYLDDINKVLVMTANPGKYGSKFLPSALKKVSLLRKIKPNLDIEVDGGINPKTIERAFKAGANNFISGSYLQKSRNQKKAVNKLQNIINS